MNESKKVTNQGSQHNHKSIDRIRQTVSLLVSWYNKDQLLDITKKSRSKPKKGQKSQKDNLITIKKKGKKQKQKKKTEGSKEQIKKMTKEEKPVIKTIE